MITRLSSSTVEDLLKLLHSWYAACVIALLLGAVSVSPLYSAGLPHPAGTAVVQPTSGDSDTVVLLENGTYSTAVNLDAEPGEVVDLYDSDLGTYSGYGGKWEAVAVASTLGTVGVVATAAMTALLGSSLLKGIGRRVRKSSLT